MRRLAESRLIRVYFYALVAIIVVALVNGGLAWWITRQAVALARAEAEIPSVLDTVADAAAKGAGVGGAIATITTALIARYGAREAARSLRGQEQHDE